MGVDLAGAILDGIPVDQSAIACIADDGPEPLVLVEDILQQVARHELVEELPQRQREPLREIFRNDGVGLLDHHERAGVRLVGDEISRINTPQISATAGSRVRGAHTGGATKQRLSVRGFVW